MTVIDPHRTLKETYWEVKYREWRPFILVSPFLTLIIGAVLGGLAGARAFPNTEVQTVDRIVTKEIPAQLPSERWTLSDKVNRIVTYANAPCDEKTITLDVVPNTAIALPPNCWVVVASNKPVLVDDSSAAKTSHTLAISGHPAVVSSQSPLYIITIEERENTVVGFHLLPRK